MQTVYVYDDNSNNLKVFILLGAVVIALIVLIVWLFPLWKRTLEMVKALAKNTWKTQYEALSKGDIVRVVVFNFIVGFVLLLGLSFGTGLFLSTEFRWVDLDTNSCQSISGEMKQFVCQEEWHRELVGYHCSFSVADMPFDMYIRAHQADTVKQLSNDNEYTVYYREYGERLVVVRIDRLLTRESKFP